MDKIVLIDEETVKVYIMSEQDKSRMVIIDKIVDPPKTMQFNLLDGLENDTRLAGLAELGVNVKMFGAKGDGTTDDTAAFKMAIAAVTALSYSGTVEIPYTGHEYIISDTIELPSNTVLRGVGTAPTLKLANSINKDFIYSTQKSNVRLENLVIDGNMANQRTDLYPGYYFRPIHMDRINGLTLKNIYAKEGVNEVIKLDICTNIYFENVTCDHSLLDCLAVTNCSYGTFVNTTLLNMLATGAYDSDDNGLEIEDGSHDLVFNGIRTENCTKSYGVKIKSHDGVAVCYKIQINNYFSKNDSAGLTVENGCYQVDIRGVNIESNVASSRGLVIGYTNAQSADVNISDIYINVLGVGIMLYGGTNIKFSNGRIVTQYYGIQFATTSNLVNISFSNLIVNSADSTVMASAHTATRTRLKFVNCYLESAANTIYLQGGTWDRLTFESCKIVIPYLSGSGRRAMLTNCFGIDFVNTRISSLSASGIVLRYSGGDINISGCQISAVTHAINIGNEDTNTGNFTDIRIDGVDVSTVTNAITVKSVAAAQVANLMILNSKFKLCKVVNWTGDQNPDKITINNNQCTTTTYADPTSGTNLVKSGNNPAALA